MESLKIYKITNLKNGMIYVGQTQRPLKERFQDHVSAKSLIGRAIRKYGKENFKIELIEECENIEQLNEREIFWIAELNSQSPNGYNLTGGGRGHLRYPHSPETKAKISAANKKHGNGRKGTKHSAATKAKISSSLMGHTFSEETKAKISKTLTGRKGQPRSEETKAKVSEGLKIYWAKKKAQNIH